MNIYIISLYFISLFRYSINSIFSRIHSSGQSLFNYSDGIAQFVISGMEFAVTLIVANSLLLLARNYMYFRPDFPVFKTVDQATFLPRFAKNLKASP